MVVVADQPACRLAGAVDQPGMVSVSASDFGHDGLSFLIPPGIEPKCLPNRAVRFTASAISAQLEHFFS